MTAIRPRPSDPADPNAPFDADTISTDVELSLRDLRVIAKSMSITLDVIDKKRGKCVVGSNRYAALTEERRDVDLALDAVREAQADLDV